MPQGVLILDDAGGAASGPFYNDVVSALRGSVNRDPAKQYSIYVEHLDFNRFRGPEYELGLKNFFSTKYKDHPVGVIVAVGVGALQYVLRSRAELWPAVPVVFHIRQSATIRRAPRGCDWHNIQVDTLRHGCRRARGCTRPQSNSTGG